MNNVFRPLINKSVLVYIDDILVMSNSAEEHVRHLKEVLELMRQHKLYAKRSKCEFNKTELTFLGHIVGEHGIAVDPAKVKVVREWHVPRNLKDLQAFLGLANYFRRFIPNFSAIAAPLTDLTSKTAAAQFDWQKFGGAHLKAFNGLKDALCSAPVLALPDFTKPFVVCTDASLVGTGAVLLQEGRPIAYTSKKLSPPETRYSTGDQELLAIIRAVREWRCYLDGAVDVTIQTDHNPLIYLQTQANLSRRQTRWMEELSRYKYEIRYHPGADNVADPISRNPALSMPATESCPVLLLVPGHDGAVLAATTRRTAAELRKVAEREQAVARERAYEAGKLTPPADMAAGTPRGLQPGGPGPLVEFAINNAKQESTRCTPFYLNYGYHPRVAELLDLPQRVPQAHEFVANARQAVEQARQCLARAQKRMKAYQDTKRRDAVFEPGDMVLLSTQNMRGRVGQPGARKLKPRYVGPFRVEYMVGRAAVKLDLPEEWSRIHNVFHVSLVKPYRTYDASDQVPGHAGPPPLQWLDGEPEYKVEQVVGHRLAKSQGKRGGKPKKRQWEFLVKWQGHGDEHNTWESRSQLVGCQELLTAYLQKLGLEADMVEAEALG